MDSIEELHAFDQTVIDDFRTNEGLIPDGRPLHGKQLLLLTMSGVNPGRRRTIPLLYAIDGRTWIVAASAGGRPKDPMWVDKLRRSPEIVVELPGSSFPAVAHETAGLERDRAFAVAAMQMKNLQAHQELVGRRIPLFRLVKISQGALIEPAHG